MYKPALASVCDGGAGVDYASGAIGKMYENVPYATESLFPAHYRGLRSPQNRLSAMDSTKLAARRVLAVVAQH